MAPAPGGIFFIEHRLKEQDDTEDVILSYDGYKITEEFVIAAEGAQLNDIAFYGDVGWAVGSYQRFGDEGLYKPLMVEYRRGVWKEVRLNSDEVGSLNAVFPVSESALWLIADPNSSGGGRLYKYDGTRFKRVERFTSVRRGAYGTKTGAFYVTPGTPPGETRLSLTYDGGQTWYDEKPSFKGIGYTPFRVDVACAIGDALYLTVEFEGFGSGIIRRTGDPGKGEYELVFFSYISPAFHDIRTIAFEDPGKGVAVGTEGSVYFDGETWHVESLPYRLGFRDVGLAAGGGFFALTDNATFSRKELFYHY